MWFMAAAMIATTVASTAMQAKAAQDQGIAGQGAANAQAEGARRRSIEDDLAADETKTQVVQEEANRMEKLSGMIGTSAANAAASGITSDSASLEAIQGYNREQVGRGMLNVSYNGTSQEMRLRRQAQYGRDASDSYVAAGKAARTAADTAMYGALFKGASSIAMYASMPSMGGSGAAAGGGAQYGPPAPAGS